MRVSFNGARMTVSPKFSSKKAVLFSILLLLGGLVFAGFGILDFLPSNYDKNGIEATAVIRTLDEYDNGRPTVRFKVDGVAYEGELSRYDSSMTVGKTVTIRYMEADPNDFVLAKEPTFVSYAYIAFGCILMLGAVLVFVSYKQKSLNRIYKIKQNGTPIECCLVGFTVGILGKAFPMNISVRSATRSVVRSPAKTAAVSITVKNSMFPTSPWTI